MTRKRVPVGTRSARALRRRLTGAEKVLWSGLSGRQGGCRFRRQVPIGPYVVDFLCAKHKLVVEADGEQHYESWRDERRDRWLGGRGYTVLRFWNNEVLGNLKMVLDTIAGHCHGGK